MGCTSVSFHWLTGKYPLGILSALRFEPTTQSGNSGVGAFDMVRGERHTMWAAIGAFNWSSHMVSDYSSAQGAPRNSFEQLRRRWINKESWPKGSGFDSSLEGDTWLMWPSLNSNIEFRNSKQIRNSKFQITKRKKRGYYQIFFILFPVFRILVIWYCLGFRA